MMDDAVYEFLTDSRQKKNIGISAKKKRGSVMGPRGCRLPSDSLTRKEIEKMNGEVNNYNMSKPVKYNEFKKWPEDIQREYLGNLISKYNVAQFRVAEMLGISKPTVYQLCRRLGFKFPRHGGNDKTDIPAWNVFLSGSEKTQAEREDDTIKAIQQWYAGKTSEPEEIKEFEEKLDIKHEDPAIPIVGAFINVEIDNWRQLFTFLLGIDISDGAQVEVRVRKNGNDRISYK